MKKKLALMLATITTVAGLFTGCGEKDVHGNYSAVETFSDVMDESDIKDMEEAGLDVKDLGVDVKLELTEDKKFTFEYDVDSFKKEYTEFVQNNIDALIDYQLSSEGLTRDDITEDVAIYLDYESVDALFEGLKEDIYTSAEAFADSLDAQMDSYTVTGTYKVSKDKVIFVIDDEGDVSFGEGIINEDGTIDVDVDEDGDTVTLKFSK
ncbi:hypothetical protein [Pseudobutyrivibrio ruminis]|uniref:Uncharacterized protein n=1 Tax=Pseudobutyrivibrio ruminis TaxID=46206 RepID=A0A2G3DYU4_9FIRM|nr:hypothetical protein [Pseudobutyrivibrio ruminis]PHU36053.1 hypothetical protein CSX01_02140 [Pseudobutyrivibrio ruminis]